jgi:hypothetical protein
MYLWWAHAASSETAGTICRLTRPTDTHASSSSPTRQRQKSLTDTQASSSPEKGRKLRRDAREEEEEEKEGRQILSSPIRAGKGGKGRDTSPEKVREMWWPSDRSS